jgi:hypothetical protein
MASNNQTYTQQTQFGISNGPTYSGVTSVTNSTSTAPRLYSALCLHGVTTTIDASGFVYDNFVAMGFKALADSVQTGTPTSNQLATASCSINLVDGLSGGATDLVLSLGVNNSLSYVAAPATLAHNVTSITVTGDTNVDLDIYGILMVTE